MYARQGESLRGISKWLNERGLKTTRGGQFNPTTVHDMLRVRIYCGDVIWGKRRQGKFSRDENIWKDTQDSRLHDENKWVTFHEESLRIIDEELWNATQARIKSRQLGPYEGPKRQPRYPLLAGLIFSERCGDKYYPQVEQRGNRVLERYRDHNHNRLGPCKKGIINAKPLHEFAERIIIDSISPPLIKEAIQVAGEMLRAENGIDTKIQGGIMPEIRRLEKERSKLIRYLKDVPYSQALAEELATLEDQIQQMEDMRSRLSEDCSKELAVLAQIEAGALDFAEMWARGTSEARQRVARAIIRKVVISEDHDTTVWEYFPLPLGGVKSVRAEGGDFPPLAPHVAGLWAGQILAYGGGEPPRDRSHRILSYTHSRRETKMRIRPVSGEMTFILTFKLLQVSIK